MGNDGSHLSKYRFTPLSGRAAIQRRWAMRDAEFDAALIRAGEAFTGRPMRDAIEAEGILFEAVALIAMSKGSAAHAKLVLQTRGVLGGDGPTYIEQQQVVVISPLLDDPSWWEGVLSDENYAKDLLIRADWSEAPDMERRLRDELLGGDNDSANEHDRDEPAADLG